MKKNHTLEYFCFYWYIKLTKYTAYSPHMEILSSSVLDPSLRKVNHNLKHSHSYVQEQQMDN